MKAKTIIATLLLLLAVGLTAKAQSSTWSLGIPVSLSNKTVTITRSNSDVEETINYRTAAYTAIEGIHFTRVEGSLTFAPGETQKTFTLVETGMANVPLVSKVQTSQMRKYKVELVDAGGFVIKSGFRELVYGDDYHFKAIEANKSISDLLYYSGTQQSGVSHGSTLSYVDVPYTPPTSEVESSGTLNGYVLIDDSYDYSQKAATVSNYKVFNSNSSEIRNYVKTIGNKLYAAVYFREKEQNDGYAYIQICTGSSSYDGNDPDGEVNNPSNSIYKACFELYKNGGNVYSGSEMQFFPHRYDYVNYAAEHASGTGIPNTYTEFSLSYGYLWEQKFKSGYRASDASALVIDPTTVDGLTIRFDAAGSGEDTFGFKDLNVCYAILDTTPPSLNSITVSPGPYSRGNPFSMSLSFSEKITAKPHTATNNYVETSSFETTWGRLYYESGDGTNVITYSGTIADDAVEGTALTIIGLNSDHDIGLFQDDAGNRCNSGSLFRTFSNLTISPDHAYSISYYPNGGTMPDSYASSYTYSSGVTLPNPVKEGKIFMGWYDNASLTGSAIRTISNYSHGDRVFYAKWQDDFTYGHTGDVNDPYLIHDTGELDLFSVNSRNTNYEGKYIKLANDITYTYTSSTTENFTAITGFNGTFDGDGHTISGIRAEKGLFSSVLKYGIICNLTVTDCRFTGDSKVGGIASQSGGRILNCRVTNTVLHGEKNTANCFGGIVGLNIQDGIISGCISNVKFTVGSSGSDRMQFGGITGVNYSVVENCLAIGCTVPSIIKIGAIVGEFSEEGSASNNYYRDCKVGVNTSNIGYGYSGGTADGNGARLMRAIYVRPGIHAVPVGAVTAYNLTGITAYGTNALMYEGVLYSGATQEIPLTLSHDAAPDGYLFNEYTVTSGTLTGNDTDGYVLTMPDEDVTIKGFAVDPSQIWGSGTDGSQGNPYVISNVEGWDMLAEEVADGKTYTGKYFRMGADFGPVTTTVGTEAYPFAGSFDGDGHTLTLDLTEVSKASFCAPFRYINGATIQNLRTDGTIDSNGQAAAGIVGTITDGTVAITNCCSSVSITASHTSASPNYTYDAGIVGIMTAGTTSINGCVFDGRILLNSQISSSGNSAIMGRFNGGTLNLTNCLVAPLEITVSSIAPLVTNGAPTNTACYRARPLSGNAYSSTAATEVYRATLADGIVATRSGGTAIGAGTGLHFADGASLESTQFYTAGATVTLSPALGYTVTAVSYNDGTDHAATANSNGTWSFTMPNGNVTVSVTATSNATLDITARQASFAGQARYWATFYHPTWSYRLPAGAQAFTMDNTHALYRVGDGSIIPADCAVIIMADSADITLNVTSATAPSVSGNILQGTSAEATKSGVFVMSKVGNEFGFFNFTGTVPANKAYYVE